MPAWVQIVARINPLTRAISVIRQAIVAGVKWSLGVTMGLLMAVFALTAMGVAVLVIRRTQWAGR